MSMDLFDFVRFHISKNIAETMTMFFSFSVHKLLYGQGGLPIMKTIREIAEEIGVSRQAVYQKINKPPLSKVLQPYVSKENGLLTITFDGEFLIKQAFSNINCQVKPSSVDTSIDNDSKISFTILASSGRIVCIFWPFSRS